MAQAKWGDYSGGYPGGAALKAAGYTGVIRYVGVGSAGKRITAAEYKDLVTHGLKVLLVCELNTHDAEGGYNAGHAKATAALADARALGIPDSVGIAAACDEHLTASQIPTTVDYVRGFRDVLGLARTGAYGFAEFVDAVHAKGYAAWWWKCGSAPTASESTWVNIWQRNTNPSTQTVAKVVVDIDDQYNSLEEDVAVTDADATLIANKILDMPLTREGNGQTGNTSLRAVLEWFDSAQSVLQNLARQADADAVQADADARQADADAVKVGANLATQFATLDAELKALPAAQVDSAAVAAALEAQGLPAQLVEAFTTLLAKAAAAPTTGA